MKLNTKLIFLLGIIILLFSILIFNQINTTNYLYNYDSWHHIYFVEYGESNHFFSDFIETYDGKLTSSYKSFFRSEIYIFYLITGINSFTIFQFASIFLRVLFILMIYITALTFTKNKKISLLTTILIFTSYYFVWRSYLMFPENLVVIFFLICIWALENYRVKSKKTYLLILTISIFSVAYIHPISLIYLSLIIASYLLYFIISKNFVKMKTILIYALLSIIFILPISRYLFFLLKNTIFGNIGSRSAYGSIAKTMVQYTPPTLSTYIHYTGILIILFSILGIVYLLRKNLLRKNINKNLPIIFLTIFTFILSLGSRLHIYIPTARLQAYLFIPLIILSSLYLNYFLSKKRNYLKCLIIFVIVTFAIINVLATPPWFALWHGEVEMGNYLNENFDSTKLYYFEDTTIIEFTRFQYPTSITKYRTSADYIITKNKDQYKNYKLIRQFKEYYLVEK